MTVREFLERLSKVRGFSLESNGAIIFKIENPEKIKVNKYIKLSPILAICNLLKKTTYFYNLDELCIAGKTLGLNKSDIIEIDMACDGVEGHNPALRKKLFKAIGLVEKEQTRRESC